MGSNRVLVSAVFCRNMFKTTCCENDDRVWSFMKSVCHCVSTWKIKTFSLVFPGSSVPEWPRSPQRSSAPPPRTHQLLGAGGESGSPGRLSCPPLPLFLLLLLLLFLFLGHPSPPVRHLIQERGAQPPFSPLSHPSTPLGAEDGLQRAGRKREDEH